MSHSSLVVLPDAEFWSAHASIDRKNPHLRDKLGRAVTFEELERAAGDGRVAEASVEHLAGQVETMRRALARLRDDVAALEPDVLVVFGDDQQEFHDETNLPALGVYYGEQLVMGTSMRFVTYQEELGDATPLMRGYAMDRRYSFPWPCAAGARADRVAARAGLRRRGERRRPRRRRQRTGARVRHRRDAADVGAGRDPAGAGVRQHVLAAEPAAGVAQLRPRRRAPACARVVRRGSAGR